MIRVYVEVENCQVHRVQMYLRDPERACARAAAALGRTRADVLKWEVVY